MKKLTMIICVCLMSNLLLSQEVIFEQKEEKARYKQAQGIATILVKSINLEEISESQWSNLVNQLREKDGYIGVQLQGQQILVHHENWVCSNDLIDILKTCGLFERKE